MRKIFERAVENFLGGHLHTRIERRPNLCHDRCGARHAQGVGDEMTRIERDGGVIEQPGLGAYLIALPGREITALLHPVSQLIEGAPCSRGVVPKVHSRGRTHQHRQRQRFSWGQRIEPAVEVKTCRLTHAPAALRVGNLIEIETQYLRLRQTRIQLPRFEALDPPRPEVARARMNHSHHLLGDGAGAANGCALTDVQPQGREARRPVDAVMLVKMLIFRDDKSGPQQRRHIRERHHVRRVPVVHERVAERRAVARENLRFDGGARQRFEVVRKFAHGESSRHCEQGGSRQSAADRDLPCAAPHGPTDILAGKLLP